MGFVKEYELLEETHHVSDSFDVSDAVKRLNGLFQNVPNLSTILYVGPYGVGKSTAIHQLLKDDKKTYLEFDAWKYPDRKDLWENFVLELARQFDDKTFAAFEKMLDGKQNDDKQALVGTVAGILPFGGDSLKEGVNHFLATSPATRTYQIQKILTDLINEKMKDKQVVIIIEDIDRAGEAGIFFLETLKTYRNTLDNKLKIKCIVPVSTVSFESHPDSYLKCIDVIDYFRTPNPNLDDFMERLLDEEKIEPLERRQITQFFDRLFTRYGSQMSPRLLKLILRAANSKYEVLLADNKYTDARIVVMVEAMKFLQRSDAVVGQSQTAFQYVLTQRAINDHTFRNLLLAIELSCDLEDRRVENGDHAVSYQFSSLVDPQPGIGAKSKRCLPWSADSHRYVHDFYFNY